MPLLPTQCSFFIKLEADKMILNGSTEESAGVVLRGVVHLNCRSKLKAKAVRLQLTRTIKRRWTDKGGSSQSYHRQEKTIVYHTWIMLPIKKETYVLHGDYQWDIEVPLPGDLPESIENQFGSINYNLEAIIERAVYVTNYITHHPIQIERLIHPTFAMNQTITISNVWSNKIMYDVCLPSKVYHTNQSIPVTFTIAPLVPNLTIISVTFLFTENVVMEVHRNVYKNKRIVQCVKDECFPTPANGRWIKTQEIDVPSQPDVHYDTSGCLVKVSHNLQLKVALMNEAGHTSELRMSIPIMIFPDIPEDMNVLPMYEEVNTVFYRPSIERAPSYRTAMALPVEFLDPSPAYETVI
ncbi:hypothetical protein BDF14DRAFT_1763828 [Spinellus fusiger]|nr:hypothetical protein BDF14DRAFT_1763828 [Spinellus fusiger]